MLRGPGAGKDLTETKSDRHGDISTMSPPTCWANTCCCSWAAPRAPCPLFVPRPFLPAVGAEGSRGCSGPASSSVVWLGRPPPISSPAWRAAAVTLAVGEMKLAAGTCIFLKTQPFKDMMSLNKHSKVTLFSPRGAVPEPGSGIPGGWGGVSRRAVCWSAPSPSSGSWPQALRTRCGCPGPGGWSPSSRCLK